MDKGRENQIKAKAKEISDISEEYQMIHATHACQKLIEDKIRRGHKAQYDTLSKRIRDKIEKGEEFEHEMKEKKRLEDIIRERKFYLDVAYLSSLSSENEARVVKINNAFVIYLSRALANRVTRVTNGQKKNDYEVIRKIRHLMAHELGHLALHTDDLLKIDSLQGSKLITDSVKEDEANCFGEELIELRKQRNKKIHDDGGAHILL